MYLGIDVHKRYAQVALMYEAGKIVEEVRIENANLEEARALVRERDVGRKTYQIRQQSLRTSLRSRNH